MSNKINDKFKTKWNELKQEKNCSLLHNDRKGEQINGRMSSFNSINSRTDLSDKTQLRQQLQQLTTDSNNKQLSQLPLICGDINKDKMVSNASETELMACQRVINCLLCNITV